MLRTYIGLTPGNTQTSLELLSLFAIFAVPNGKMTMWQRIQTLYLGVATALMFSMFFCTFATIVGPNGSEITIGYSEKRQYLMLMIMIFIAHVAATASFKSFFLQARVAAIAALLAIGFQIWLGVDMLANRHDMSFSFTAIFPLAAAILDFMAAKRSIVDEFTVTAVRSAKRMKRNKK